MKVGQYYKQGSTTDYHFLMVSLSPKYPAVYHLTSPILGVSYNSFNTIKGIEFLRSPI